jgi:hypothetical protein
MIAYMAHLSDLYEDVTQVYLRLIRKASSHAAVHIAEIIPLCGAAAALRAAVILAVIKIEVRQDRWIPGKSIYASLIEDHPVAIICCLQAWGVLADVTDEWTRPDYSRAVAPFHRAFPTGWEVTSRFRRNSEFTGTRSYARLE